jgi:hypothetical protein
MARVVEQTIENTGPKVERLPKNYEVVNFVNDVALLPDVSHVVTARTNGAERLHLSCKPVGGRAR